MSASEEIDRLIRALHAVKSDVADLEARRPVVDPAAEAAAKDDPNPFNRIFGRDRGSYFKRELARIEEVTGQIAAELRRLKD